MWDMRTSFWSEAEQEVETQQRDTKIYGDSHLTPLIHHGKDLIRRLFRNRKILYSSGLGKLAPVFRIVACFED